MGDVMVNGILNIQLEKQFCNFLRQLMVEIIF